MHIVYCIIGRSCSGKSAICKGAAEELKLKVLQSYTTRSKRNGETEEESDHIFIKAEEVDALRQDMVAYTERCGYCSFTTRQQLMESDICIINPSGYYELKLKTKDMDIMLVPIYITVPYRTAIKRAKKRGGFESWKENYDKENNEFGSFEKSNIIEYRILNDNDLEEAVGKLVRIINKVRGENA
ncbi:MULTISPECIES: hypothetical protein [unclassified Lactonifactor]|nr:MULTISPECIES: hypothetical protein [unclassified Lactonifactor]